MASPVTRSSSASRAWIALHALVLDLLYVPIQRQDRLNMWANSLTTSKLTYSTWETSHLAIIQFLVWFAKLHTCMVLWGWTLGSQTKSSKHFVSVGCRTSGSPFDWPSMTTEHSKQSSTRRWVQVVRLLKSFQAKHTTSLVSLNDTMRPFACCWKGSLIQRPVPPNTISILPLSQHSRPRIRLHGHQGGRHTSPHLARFLVSAQTFSVIPEPWFQEQLVPKLNNNQRWCAVRPWRPSLKLPLRLRWGELFWESPLNSSNWNHSQDLSWHTGVGQPARTESVVATRSPDIWDVIQIRSHFGCRAAITPSKLLTPKFETSLDMKTISLTSRTWTRSRWRRTTSSRASFMMRCFRMRSNHFTMMDGKKRTRTSNTRTPTLSFPTFNHQSNPTPQLQHKPQTTHHHHSTQRQHHHHYIYIKTYNRHKTFSTNHNLEHQFHTRHQGESDRERLLHPDRDIRVDTQPSPTHHNNCVTSQEHLRMYNHQQQLQHNHYQQHHHCHIHHNLWIWHMMTPTQVRLFQRLHLE